MPLIPTLSKTFCLASSRNLLNCLQIQYCFNYSSDSPSAQSTSTNPYVLFIKERSQSGEKVEGGMKGYAKLWKELPETIKQKYREKAGQINQDIYIEPEPKRTNFQPKRFSVKKRSSRWDDEESINPEAEDKFMNLAYEPISKKELLAKSEEKETKRRQSRNKSKSVEKVNATDEEEKMPRSGPISPYYLFMTRVANRIPDTPQRAAQILGLWRKLSDEKKAEYKQMAEDLTKARKEKVQEMTDEQKHLYKEKRLEQKANWSKSPNWKDRMDELLVKIKKDEKYKEEDDQAFPNLSKEEIEMKNKLLKDQITITKKNIGTITGPLDEEKLVKQFRVRYMSMKGEEQENEAITEEKSLIKNRKIRSIGKNNPTSTRFKNRKVNKSDEENDYVD